MKSITVHKLDEELADAIKKIVDKTGLSQNKVVKRLLKKALNLSESNSPRQDFSAFCGIWTKKEKEEFDDAIKFLEKVDKDMWK